MQTSQRHLDESSSGAPKMATIMKRGGVEGDDAHKVYDTYTTGELLSFILGQSRTQRYERERLHVTLGLFEILVSHSQSLDTWQLLIQSCLSHCNGKL